MNESVEQQKTKRKILLELESTNRYVFHGSPHLLEELEPRQAQTMDSITAKMVDDGEPAVVTSPFVDIAIFRSIINRDNIRGNYSSSFSYRDNSLSFSTNLETIGQAKEHKGYVYVFNKDDFERHSPMEYRLKNTVKPIEVIEVTSADLPSNIIISEEND